MKLTIEIITSIAAVITAVIAAVIAFRNSQIAKKALDVSKQGLEARNAGITTYLIEGIKRRTETHDLIAFALSFVNQAESPNSIFRVELEIHYATRNGSTNHLQFLMRKEEKAWPEFPSLSPIRVPLNMAARSSESGWVVFEVPRKLIDGPVDHYRLVGVTSTGTLTTVDSYLLKTVFDEEKDRAP